MIREVHADGRQWVGALGTSWFWSVGAVTLSLVPVIIKSRADPLAVVGPQLPDHDPGGVENVPVDFEPRRADPGRGNEAGGAIAGERDHSELDDDACGRTPFGRRNPPKTSPQMIAAKVAPSTSALPETSSSRRK